MLPQKHRISKKEFVGFFRGGKTIHSENMVFKFVLGSEENKKPARFSCVVSGKALKKAVERNTLKRRAYAVLNTVVKKIKPCLLGVFYFKKGAFMLEYKDLKKEMFEVLEKARVM